MIDARFAELMDEITKLKGLVEDKDKEMTEYKKQIEEKFSTTPAAQTITKKPEVKLESRFAEMEARVK